LNKGNWGELKTFVTSL